MRLNILLMEANKCMMLILILAGFVAIAQANKCAQCLNMTYYNCHICYDECREQFTSCSRTYCARRSYSGKSSHCIEYKTIKLKEADCFSFCCGEAIEDRQFSLVGLEKCRKQNKRKSTIVIAITMTLLGLSTALIICCACRGNYKFRNCMRSFFESVIYLITCCNFCECLKGKQKSINKNQIGMEVSLEQINAHSNTNYWVSEPIPNSMIVDRNNSCPICLSGNINTITQCGHGFHLGCIYEWRKKKADCPLCKSQNTSSVRLYCRQCCSRFTRIDLQKSTQAQIMNVKDSNCSFCQ